MTCQRKDWKTAGAGDGPAVDGGDVAFLASLPSGGGVVNFHRPLVVEGFDVVVARVVGENCSDGQNANCGACPKMPPLALPCSSA